MITTTNTTIKHILANGQEKKNIRGHLVELTQVTDSAYRILTGILQKQASPAATGTEGRCIT